MNSSKSGLVGVLSFAALLAASTVLSFAAGRTASAHAGPAPSAVVRDAEPTVTFVPDELPPSRPALGRKASRRPSIATSSDVCYVRAFHDGNDTSVRTCTPADLIGR